MLVHGRPDGGAPRVTANCRVVPITPEHLL